MLNSIVRTNSIALTVPRFYNLEAVCHAHGWKNLAPFEWDPKKGILFFAIFDQDISIDVEVIQRGGNLFIDFKYCQKDTELNSEIIKNAVIRALGVNQSIDGLYKLASKVGSEYKKLICGGAGRLLLAPTLWEDAAKTLFTTNCSWSLTKKICESFCSDKFVKPSPSGRFPFPQPSELISITESALRRMTPIGYRARSLIRLARIFNNDPTLNGIEKDRLDFKSAYKIVRNLHGFGDYATNHLLVLAGYYNQIPIDSVVVSYLKRNYRVLKPASFIDRKYRRWGEYKWWGLKLEKMLKRQNWLGD